MCWSKEYIEELKRDGYGIGVMKRDVFDRIELLFPYIVHFKIAGWGALHKLRISWDDKQDKKV